MTRRERECMKKEKKLGALATLMSCECPRVFCALSLCVCVCVSACPLCKQAANRRPLTATMAHSHSHTQVVGSPLMCNELTFQHIYSRSIERTSCLCVCVGVSLRQLRCR